ncbi:type II toxin-antitoxin system VapB family antitoxin [Microbacterium elymi]|uniref:Type II toxin-antitoxin system VapB family antitoxin n=1 Tax=Microbacterium elymi TaxID=2909587 RepID=A0ABY5NH05_9MICO|nr:type II toxin-antitoxin system VapB family antitoxin [Microbacterium elymi]UUT34394.1 type II toxin-antitoxin system VapB family antitoxin [Microbacterium elymi]
MTRTNIDLDDSAVESVMRRFAFSSKRDAVNYALRALAADPLDVDKALALRGSGWEGDLDALRESRAS